MKKFVIVCKHLVRLPELPCVEELSDAITPQDSGRAYLCVPCATRPTELDPDEDLAVVCECHCDAMTITHTVDNRTLSV